MIAPMGLVIVIQFSDRPFRLRLTHPHFKDMSVTDKNDVRHFLDIGLGQKLSDQLWPDPCRFPMDDGDTWLH